MVQNARIQSTPLCLSRRNGAAEAEELHRTVQENLCALTDQLKIAEYLCGDPFEENQRQ